MKHLRTIALIAGLAVTECAANAVPLHTSHGPCSNGWATYTVLNLGWRGFYTTSYVSGCTQ